MSELDAIVAQKVQEALSQQQAESSGTAPLELNIAGQKFKFNSREDLERAIQNMVQTYAAEMTAAQQQVQKAAEEAKAPSSGEYVRSDEPNVPPFDVNRYAKLMVENPMAAMDYLDSYRYFGGAVEKPSEVVRNMFLEMDRMQKVLDAYRFRDSHPELAYLPAEKVAEVINKVREESGLPWNYDGLEAAHALAVQRGLIPSREAIWAWLNQQQAAAAQQQAMGGPNPVPMPTMAHANPAVAAVNVPPPRVPGVSTGGSGTDLNSILARAEELPEDKLREILQNVANPQR